MSFSSDWNAICPKRIGVAELTRLAMKGTDLKPLWHQLMQTISDDPQGAAVAMDLSIIAQLLGDQKIGFALQKDALEYCQIFRAPLRTKSAGLRVLAFAAAMDIGANTPLEFLLEDSDIEVATVYLIPGKPMPSLLPEHDIAIVIAPADEGASHVLNQLEGLLSNWPRPVLNLPQRIAQLDRDRLYRIIGQIPGLEIPRTLKVNRATLRGLAKQDLPRSQISDPLDYPLIVRPVGSHAGRGLARLDDHFQTTAYLQRHEENDFFISPYINYMSLDGKFRKYRVVVVDGIRYACHMAVAADWKVWYLNADMGANHPHRMEEARFLEQFNSEFSARHATALKQMHSRLGLDYFAIDCAENSRQELLIFEADNTAIVHDMDPPEIYPYKSAQMQTVFRAVQAMFYRRAGRVHASAA